jgi:hypothetical protein
VAPWSADPRAAAVAAALAPYAWRELTDRMLARRALAAVDRHSVVGLILSVRGAVVGELEPIEPVEDGDRRLDVLVRALTGRRWRRFSLDRLCVELLAALDGWQARRDSFDPGVGRLLDDR